MVQSYSDLVRPQPSSKKTILIVDDDPLIVELIQDQLDDKPNLKAIVAGNFADAVKLLLGREHDISGVILDNGFPLTANGKRVGKARLENAGTADEVKKSAAEGGAGAMLLRFMRSGETGAQRDSSKTEMDAIIQQAKADLGADYDSRLQSLKTVPVVWHSASPEVGKVAGIREVVKGRLIPDEARYADNSVTIEPGQMDVVDKHTACGSKTGIAAINATISFLEKGIEQGRTCPAGG